MRFPFSTPPSRRDAFIGFLVGTATLAFLAFLIACVGSIDISADRPHGWLAEHVLHFVFNRSVALHSDSVIPPQDLTARSRVLLGAQHYAMVCSNCHGGPDIGQSSVALSIQPRPQSLKEVVRQFTPPELFWIVKHGVKFSAMPSWPNQVRNDEIWSMVAFLEQLPNMTAEDYRAMTSAADAPSDKPIAAEKSPSLRNADTDRNNGPTKEFLYAVPAIGFSDANLVSDPLRVCTRCHGKDGSGNATGGETPNLTIQDANYIHASLNAYALGSRKSGFMQQIAGQLSKDQIARLSDYFAQLPVRESPSTDRSSTLVDEGKEIALKGVNASAIPACATCHESPGDKPIAAPHIAGQSENYLRHELEAMRYGGRGTTGLWNPMSGVAHDLSDRDIEAVATYYASLPPSKNAAGEQPTVPEGNIAKGELLFSKQCVTCHVKGAKDDPAGGIPNLSIQTNDYLAQALRAYRAGTKSNIQMNNAAHGLEDAQIVALASYIGGLPPEASSIRGNETAAQRGEKLANNGDPSRKISSCMTCHSKEAVGQLPLIARLQGQNPNYLRSRLDYFASADAARAETALNPMPAISRQLSDQEKSDVAAYFSSVQPLAK
jgi:cytochrome c553